jgi:hypothetical protein
MRTWRNGSWWWRQWQLLLGYNVYALTPVTRGRRCCEKAQGVYVKMDHIKLFCVCVLCAGVRPLRKHGTFAFAGADDVVYWRERLNCDDSTPWKIPMGDGDD